MLSSQNTTSDSSSSSTSSQGSASGVTSESVKSNEKDSSKGHGRQRDRSGSKNSSSGTKSVLQDPSFAKYNCGPCLDEVMCKRLALLLSEKDLEVLKNGPIIYK